MVNDFCTCEFWYILQSIVPISCLLTTLFIIKQEAWLLVYFLSELTLISLFFAQYLIASDDYQARSLVDVFCLLFKTIVHKASTEDVLLKSKERNKNWNSNRKYKQEINKIANEYLKEKKRKEERRRENHVKDMSRADMNSLYAALRLLPHPMNNLKRRFDLLRHFIKFQSLASSICKFVFK